MNNRLRVGVVGCGIGQGHIHAYRSLPEQFDVVAVCDVDGARAREVATRLQVPRAATNLADVCRMDDLDVINVCTPSYLHSQQVLEVLAAGKHAVCEKPVAGSLKEVDELMQAEARSGRRVMPIFQARFGHGVQKLKFLIEERVAGQAFLSTVETTWRRRAEYYASWHGRWETELGGALVTLAIHSHDVLYYVLGPARNVFARAATMVNPIETEDCVSASLEMADGSFASLSVTTGSALQASRLRFCFRNLTAESNTLPYSPTSDPWTFVGDSPELERQIEETLARFVPLPEGFIGQFTRFHQAVQQGTELPVTLADARAALELITAIYTSAQTGQAVALPITPSYPASPP